MIELYRKHRPKSFGDMIGQDAALRPLAAKGKAGKLPHAILFTGPSGTGKTTVARILRKKLKCADHDFYEVNAAKDRGIDLIRSIERMAGFAPVSGDCRVWLCDEAHKLTSDAQGAFLKLLEDTPEHVYFFLATTHPHKLLPTIRTRCTQVEMKPLKREDMYELLHRVYSAENSDGDGSPSSVPEDIADKIIDLAEGSPRKALVLLDQVIDIENEDEALAALSAATGQEEAIKLARLLIKPRVRWKEVAAVLKKLQEQEEDPEGLRLLVLGYCKSVLLGAGNLTPRAFEIMECFSEDFYSTKWAGLCMACYDAVTSD